VTTEYITLAASVTGNPERGYRIEHYWDGKRFSTKAEAVSNGFELDRSDDFNVGIVSGHGLLSVWWMDEQIDEPPETLAAIAKEIGL
jgi:hypothetical protein